MRPLAFAIPLAVALVVADVIELTVPAAAREYDIPWFEAHPAERQATLRDCRNDRRVGRLPICDNAQTAETNAYLRKNVAPNVGLPWEPSPRLLGAIAKSCAMPGPHLFEDACRKMK